tara:strand:+ start:633 stop:1175 length:543 start_codon:yes stop_codon:yes gene_type:complete
MAHSIWINTETKEITSILLYQPSPESEGIRADGIHYVKHLEIEKPEDFMETHYSSDDYATILERPVRPNGFGFATWNRSAKRWECTLDDYLSYIREIRNRKLSECDFVMLSDIGLSELSTTTWKGYRQQLRNITQLVKDAQTQADKDGTDNPYLIFEAEVAWPETPTLHQPEDKTDLGGT